MTEIDIPEPPRRFRLVRRIDETGVSGTGVVAEGIEFGDGAVAMRWRSEHASTAAFASIDDVRAIHGHGGKTTVMWIDTGQPAANWQGAWAELTGYVREAEADGGQIDPAALRQYMAELRRKALAPVRDWMNSIAAGGSR